MAQFSNEPDRNDPGQVFAERAMEALRREFADDTQVPRFAIVIETPPDGRIAIGSTGDDVVDVHRMLALGSGAARASMSPADKRRARQLWTTLEAGFERRN